MGCTNSKPKEILSKATTLPPAPQPHNDIRFKYDFVKIIGRGHYGTVRLANLKSHPEEMVAIKTLTKKKVATSTAALQQEIRILFAVDHPNIIRLHEVFEDDKYMHLVIEYCSGGELLDHLMSMGRYSEHDAARLLNKILLAVNNLHQNNVCHRDLKPDNFMFENTDPHAELKLIDFGLAHKFFNKAGSSELKSFVGTPDYVAPEVLQGGYGPKCDLWSVGVILYVMLSGRLPFAGNSVNEIYAKILSGEFATNTDVWANISPSAIDLLLKLLVLDPQKRLSAEEALEHDWFAQSPTSPLIISRDILESLKKYRTRSKFQAEVHNVIAKCLNTHQIRDMKATFMALDIEKNGFLSFQELEQGLLTAGYQMAAHEIEEILQNADFKRDGRINYSEFLAATLESRDLLDDDVMWKAFNKFDVDSTGVITESNLKQALERAGRQVSSSHIRDMMREVGANEEGINYEEFKKLVKHDSL